MAWRPDVREELLYVRNHCFRMTLNFMIGKLAPIMSYELMLRTLIDV